MTNLEAKQEAIKNAYGEHFFPTDKNGWIRHLMYCPSDLGIENYDEMDGFWRCKSLQGIENNNGWIKIESEADLPKNDDDYWVMTNIKGDEVQQLSNLIVIRCLNLEKNIKVTHFQPIEKPKPPIY